MNTYYTKFYFKFTYFTPYFFYLPAQNIQSQIFISHSHTSNNAIYESDLDLDPFIGSHEIEELKNFSAKAVSENEVRVKFELFGEKRDITLRLICDKDCLIDDVKLSDGGSLKAKIKKSLKAAYPSNYGKIFKE
ncbi:hypothetical protein H740_00220 [Campylobacter showae CC57C]|uniref:Uncharacterized protein n=1 Tax=Campylobacter showae CC57C TaxID=1073353 RepID=M3JG52_9BACT|nr:hypothetical protein H740_00220 [Campylobacter showae CC57C]